MSHPRGQSSSRARLHRGLRLGNYVIEEKIGSGSQADVFLARDVVLERPVALKVFPRAQASRNAHTSLREARLIARLDAPTIVRVYHIEQTPALNFLAIEYVDGGSLDAVVRRSGAVPVRQAVKFAMAVFDGLQHAHELGIVHSDINPKNLLISKSGQLKIADFGLAFLWETPSSMGVKELRGTPLYMAPEVWSGQSATPLSDIYSAGACLYFMLVGRPPFVESELDALRKAHLERTVLIPAEVPTALSELIRQCMAKDPAQRPSSARAVRQSLSSFVSRVRRRRSSVIPSTESEAANSEEEANDSESATSDLPLLVRAEAEAEMLHVAVYAEASESFAAALAEECPLLVMHGGEAEERNVLLRRLFADDESGIERPSIARLEVAVEPGHLLAALGSRMGCSPDEIDKITSILELLCGSVAVRKSLGYVQVCIAGAIDETDAISMIELVNAARARLVGFVLACATDDADLVAQAAQAYSLPVATARLSGMDADSAARYLVAWTRRASGGKFGWSHDALLLACDAFEQRSSPLIVRWLEDLAVNAIYLAAHAHMRLITSWCVSGAIKHTSRIERIEDIVPSWRQRPVVWPPPELLTKLGELRARWPNLAQDLPATGEDANRVGSSTRQ
ncbi:serine/threonine-protein kinase [Haliangium ochraceum]|uniref:Serine/threonine protein kinase n=1 Tax=Haliangium ochraceum (strain DSM 14365 / JCM 11303 / SMP-2) TaxID=502025 RepID=D0LRP0_HALO1|nr:serine/threonine-protein kinase [Haliangium ochraceum]ACY19032.1 serine/threonine protein kinase [Haliangium ochraceum DSM 14365]